MTPGMTPEGLIDAQFEAILGGTDAIARPKIAKAQRELFALTPWNPTKPTRDALDQTIMYMDADGGRYTVHQVRENGAHVRREQGPMGYTGQVTTILAMAPTLEEADELGAAHANERQMVARPDRGAPGTTREGWHFRRFSLEKPRLW